MERLEHGWVLAVGDGGMVVARGGTPAYSGR
jgi:hypothetical protein